METQKNLGDLFEFEPVPLDVFVGDKNYLGLPPLSPKQREAVVYATQIYHLETIRELGWQPVKYVSSLVLLWGKGAGKDFVARIMLLRIAYLLLALKNPQGYFYHPLMSCGAERIDMLNTAVSGDQAGNVFFTPLRRYVEKSPFFKKRAHVLRDTIEFEKSIYLISGHSESEAQEGLNLIAVILDEIAAFKTDEEVSDLRRLRLRKNIPMSASSLYDFACSSVVTRFPRVGKVILLSFPRFKGDYITTKYEEGLKDPSVYTSFGATFAINPTKKLSDFAQEKKRNLTRYNCRILCEPSVAEDSFFKNDAALKVTFKKELPDPIEPYSNRFRPWFVCRDSFIRFGHCDLAKNRDRAAFCFVHAYDVQREPISKEKGKFLILELPLIKIDVVMFFTAPYGGEVNFELIRDRIAEFVEERGFRVGLLTFDGYQSIQMMQSLNAKGIKTEIQSVDRTREAYETWQDVMYEGRLTSYYPKILVEEEIPFLIDYKGRKIEHRKGRGKDGADAVAGAINNCVKSEQWGELEFWSGGGSDVQSR